MPEVPLEQSQEEIAHHAEHSGHAWIMGVALTAALLAVLAAITSLLAEYHANEAMITKLHSVDQWNFYQAKGLKANELSTRIELLSALGKPVNQKDRDKLEKYGGEQKEIRQEAEEKQKESERHLHHHEVLACSVTLFQVAIALGAISALTRRKPFWYMAIVLGVVGIGFWAGTILLH